MFLLLLSFNGLPCVGTFTQFLGCPLNTSSTLVAKIVLCLFLLACTCLHGTCDSGYPQGNGTCKAGSCSPGFHGDNCDQHDVPCPGSVSRRCHAHATCRRQGNMDR